METEKEQDNFSTDPPLEIYQTAATDKSKLPKLTIPRGERFYISLEELSDINQKFFQAVSDMQDGTERAPAELKSKMESGLELAYDDEIARVRERNRLACEVERERIETYNAILMPRTRRFLFFKRKRNQSQILLDELIARQAALYYRQKADELPEMDDEEEGEEIIQPFEIVFETLKEELPRMRRKRRARVEKLLYNLALGYNEKIEEKKEAEARAKKAEGDAQAASEMLEEFLKDSQPAPEETEEKQVAEEEEQTSDETDGQAPESAEEEESEPQDAETADEVDDEGLSYDGLDEECTPG